MHATYDSGPEFLAVSQQIGKNADILRKSGKLNYVYDKQYPLNQSEIVCEIYPRALEKNKLSFNIRAHQHTERLKEPKPDLLPRADISVPEREALLAGVNHDQLVLSAIENRREATHQSEQGQQSTRLRVAQAKASPGGLGSYKQSAENLVRDCLDVYPEGTEPSENDVLEFGVSLERYKRLFSEKEAVIREIALEILTGEEQSASSYLEYHSDERSWLEAMEAKVITGKYTLILKHTPTTLLVLDVEFQE